MTNKQRTDLIERHLREHKYADLHSLAQRFGGSLSTVRRILDGLEERGVVRRHHGGASLVEGDALAFAPPPGGTAWAWAPSSAMRRCRSGF